MNNDIHRNLNNYTINNAKSLSRCASFEKNSVQIEEKKVSDAINCLETMGKAQVQMTNDNQNIKKAINFMKKNPELVEMHLDMTDFLVKNNYSLEDAIKKTDDIFAILKDGKIWKEN